MIIRDNNIRENDHSGKRCRENDRKRNNLNVMIEYIAEKRFVKHENYEEDFYFESLNGICSLPERLFILVKVDYI